MAESRRSYVGSAERAAEIQAAEGAGLRMLHDDFAPGWQPGEEPRGVLTFTDAAEPVTPPTPGQVQRQARRARLRALLAKGRAAWTPDEAREVAELLARELLGA